MGAHGEGSITQRKDGRWQASIMVNGKRRTVYGKTSREARNKLNDLKRQLAITGALPDPGRRTLNSLLDAWLETVAHSLKPKTLHDYRATCQRHIRPVLGSVKLSRLTPDHIQRFYATFQDEGKHRTAQRIHTMLHRAFEFAVLWRWVSENPCDRVLRPAYSARRKDLWTPEQLHTFLEGTQDHWLYPLWHTAIASGARIGELTALTWDDVEGCTIAINKTMQRIAGEYITTDPKTRNSQRVITLPDSSVLRRQRAQQNTWRLKAGWSTNLVFTGKRGKPLHASVADHALQRECRRLGIPAITMHALRHLHASLLLERGVSIPQVSRRMGHANANITMQVYAHIVKREDDSAAQAIAQAIS